MPDRNVLLVSLKPRFAAMLLSGSKTVELRRVKPDVATGADVLLYASSPRRALVGSARVGAIDAGTAAAIWTQHCAHIGVSRVEYDDYFAGASTAVAITLTDISALPDGDVPLAELRRRRRDFRPPQSFRYFDLPTAASLGWGA
jgi:predicted transcriptional regulator